MFFCISKYDIRKGMYILFFQEFQSPVRKSTRKKTQPMHYGHESSGVDSPKTGNPKETFESDTSE